MSARLTFAEALSLARAGLPDTPSREAEAEQLVAAACRTVPGRTLSRREVYARAADPFPEDAAKRLEAWVRRRAAGEVLQHITGFQQFLDHEYETGPGALVPRPETEVLASEAIRELRGCSPTLGFEVGVGTGILSIELLAAFPGLRMSASEISSQASDLAQCNARRILGSASDRLEVFMAAGPLDVFGPFRANSGKADFLISNPPYLLRRGETTDEVARQEPPQALFAPEGDPQYFYRAIAQEARSVLAPHALVFVELAAERAEETRLLFMREGWATRVIDDLNRRPRVLIASQST